MEASRPMFLRDLRSSADVEPQLVSPPVAFAQAYDGWSVYGVVLHTLTKRALREQVKQIVFCKQ